MSHLVNGFKNFKSASNIFHKFATFLKDNGECTLGGNKLLERFCKVEGSKDRRTLESMFPTESTDPILEAIIEHYILSFKLWKEDTFNEEFKNFIYFCKSANQRNEIPALEDGELYIPDASDNHPFPCLFQTDLDLLLEDGEYFSTDDFCIKNAYKLQDMIDGQQLAYTFNEMRIVTVSDFNDVSSSVVIEYLRDEIRDQNNNIILNIVVNLSKAENFNDSLEFLNKIIRDVVQDKFKY